MRIDRSLRSAIEALHEATGGAVVLITGRGIANVDRLFSDIRSADEPPGALPATEASTPPAVTLHRLPPSDTLTLRPGCNQSA